MAPPSEPATRMAAGPSVTPPETAAPTATVAPAADVVAPATTAGLVVHQSFPVRQPEEDANESLVTIRGRVLRRVRDRLERLTVRKFPWPEILLGVSTLCVGGVLGALSSSLSWASVENGAASPTRLAILFYVVLPMAGLASAVGYLCLRHVSGRDAASVAEAILEELPNPDHIR